MKQIFFFGLLAAALLVLAGSRPAAAAGKAATVKGEVVDLFCYGTMGAKGESHRQCGMDCVKAGAPVGLLEEKTEKLYVLLPAKHMGSIPDTVIQKMGRTAEITGKAEAIGGSQFLTVESVK